MDPRGISLALALSTAISAAETRTPWIDGARMLVLPAGDDAAGGSVLMFTRWGWVEDHGQPARHRSLETFGGRDGERLALRVWEPDEAPRFWLHHTTVLFDAEGEPEFAALEPRSNGNDGSVLSIRSTRTGEARVLAALPLWVRPRLIRGVGDFDGDGRGDVLVLISEGRDEEGRRVLGVVASSADGGLLGSLPHLEGTDPFDFGFTVATGPGDLTGDGVDDLVVAARDDRSRILIVYSGDGFAPSRTLGPFPHFTRSMQPRGPGAIDASVDLDGDGARDVVFGCSPREPRKRRKPKPGAVRVASGRTGETLLEFPVPRDGRIDTLFLGDHDGDGVEDVFVLVARERRGLVLADFNEFEASIHSGADGELLARADWSRLGGLGNAKELALARIADVDGDGRDDLACSISRRPKDSSSEYALAVVSGATLAPSFERILVGERASAPPPKPESWRDVDGSAAPLLPPSLELIESWAPRSLACTGSLSALARERAEVEEWVDLDALRRASPKERKQARFLWSVPDLMKALANYVHEPPWSEEELEWIEGLGFLIAAYAAEPGLAVLGRDPPAVRAGLARVVAWWDESCEDREFVAELAMFMCLGPYYGTPVDPKELEGLPLVDSVELVGEGGYLELYSGSSPERLYLRHLRKNGDEHWCRRLTIQPGREAKLPAGFSEIPTRFWPGWGWTVGGFLSHHGGSRQGAGFYLDLEGEFRCFVIATGT